MSAPSAFADAKSPLPEPPEEPQLEEAPGAVELAVALLRRIGEDPGLRPSHRVAARRYLRRLGDAMSLQVGEALIERESGPG